MADTCPKCGQTAISSDKCPTCGVIIPVYAQYLEKVRRGPVATTTPLRPSPASSAPVFRPALERPYEDWGRAGAGPPSAAERRALRFHGTGRELAGIWTVSALLTLLTVGVYYFWAKTQIRRYLYAQAEIAGDRFAYHGTGQELLLGFLKAAVFFIIPIMALANAPELLDLGPVATALGGFAAVILGAVFAPLAIVGARRYRLSRTSWRGIRFSFRADAKSFIGRFIRWSLFVGLTAGFYYPVFLVRKQEFLTAHSYFGTARFRFTGPPLGLMGPYVRLVAGVVLLAAMTIFASTVGLLFPPAAVVGLLAAAIIAGATWFKFTADKRCFFWNHTRLEGATFRCSVTAGGLARLYLGNALALILTLGLAMPWVKVRNAEFTCRHLELQGAIDVEAIAQDARTAPATGEALSTFFDTDIGLG